MAATTLALLSSAPNISSLCIKPKPPPSPNFSSSSFFKPFDVSTPVKSNRIFSTRRGVAHREVVLSPKERAFRQPIYACLNSDESEFSDESELASDSQPTNTSLTEATIDIQLPRRSLLLQFTCNACGERTERLINRLAYERGTVFVQCAGCLKHHRLVDNLGLVVEYDLRKEANEDLNADQV